MAGVGIGPFKYMRREHAEALVAHGRIRIGTAYEYLRADLLGTEIGDFAEGACFFEIPRNELAIVAKDTNQGRMARWIRDMVRNSPEAVNFEKFIVGFRDVDVWMYCVSLVNDPAAMEQFGYDTCVEIIDSQTFLSKISEALFDWGSYVGTAACDYRGRGFSYWQAGTFAPYLLKEARYDYQHEARSVWQPDQNWLMRSGQLNELSRRLPHEDPIAPYVLEPILLDVPGIVGSVRIVD